MERRWGASGFLLTVSFQPETVLGRNRLWLCQILSPLALLGSPTKIISVFKYFNFFLFQGKIKTFSWTLFFPDGEEINLCLQFSLFLILKEKKIFLWDSKCIVGPKHFTNCASWISLPWCQGLSWLGAPWHRKKEFLNSSSSTGNSISLAFHWRIIFFFFWRDGILSLWGTQFGEGEIWGKKVF